MPFFKAPFLYIVIAIIGGIVIADFAVEYELYSVVFTSFSVLVLASATLSFFYATLRWLTILSSFVFIGVVLTGGVRNLTNISGENQELVLNIEEFQLSDKPWKKGIAEVYYFEEGEYKSMDRRILLFSEDYLEPSSKIYAQLDILPIQNKGNPGEFDAEKYWRSKNVQHLAFLNSNGYKVLEPSHQSNWTRWIQNIRAYSTNVIHERLDPAAASIVQAMVLGDKSELSAEVRNSFSNAGVMHVLAVSGLHVGIVMFLILFVFEKVFPRFGKGRSLFVVLILTWFYCALTGFSPSVLRATLMFSILLSARFFKRESNNYNALAFSAFILLLVNPLYIYDIGFQLSYLAMLGIFMFYSKVEQLVHFDFWLIQKAWQGTAVGIAAQIMTVPLTLYYFHQFPNYFMFSNLGVMLFAGIILSLGIVVLLFSKIPWLNTVLGWLLGISVFCLLQFIVFIEQLPYSVATGFSLSLSVVFVLYLLILAAMLFWKRSRWRLIFTSLLVVGLAYIQFGRFSGMEAKQFVLFNNNQPLLGLTWNNNTHFFYLKDSKMNSIERIIDNYTKLFPTHIEIHELIEGKNKLVIDSKDLSITIQKEFITINVFNKKLQLNTDYTSDENFQADVIWMPYLKAANSGIALSDGAYILSL